MSDWRDAVSEGVTRTINGMTERELYALATDSYQQMRNIKEAK